MNDATLRRLAAATSPREVALARRRLGLDAPPTAVVAALRQRLELRAPADAGEDVLLVAAASPGLPRRLTATWEAGGPLWCWWRGVPLQEPEVAVGIVGTRRPSADGLAVAHAMAYDLAMAGVHVVSGMARGIDQAAHRGALEGGGTTTAVLGTGLDVDYPARTGELRTAIARSGGLLTEHPHGEGVVHPSQFLARNRILAGLVDAVVVIEAGVRSGALNTAGWAGDLGRDVMVVPASPSVPSAAGALALLRDGAVPVRHAEDVLTTLGIDRPGRPGGGGGAPAPDRRVALTPAASTVLDLLGPVPASPSALAAASGLSARDVLIAVSALEAAGLAARAGGGIVVPGRRRS